MRTFNHSFAQTAYNQQAYSFNDHAQTHHNQQAKESEAAFENGLKEDAQSLEDLPGMGLGQFQQSSDGNDTSRRSAGVHDVMAERQRRLLEDGLNSKLGSSISHTAQTSQPRGRSRLDAYRERFQSQTSPAGSARVSSEFEARMEAKMEALMELHGISKVEEQNNVDLPLSPWDLGHQRAANAEKMGFRNYNYSTMTLPGDLPRVGF